MIRVSVLFNEPKLLKCRFGHRNLADECRFSALQRAEIAEIPILRARHINDAGFSALQRAEIAEILCNGAAHRSGSVFQCSSTSRNC